MLSQYMLDRMKIGLTEDCWDWKATKDRDGYGCAWNNKSQKSERAHRRVLIELQVDVPDDMIVMHKCDNPGCVNPAHLMVGTHADNMIDKTEKGRSNAPNRESGHWGAKFTSEEIQELLAQYRALPMQGCRRVGVAQLARQWGTGKEYINELHRKDLK